MNITVKIVKNNNTKQEIFDVTKESIKAFEDVRTYTKIYAGDGKEYEYSIDSWDLKKIFNILIYYQYFDRMPVKISGDGWERDMMTLFYDFNSDDGRTRIMKDIIWLLETTSINYGDVVDVSNNIYWLYRYEGDLYFESQDQILDTIKCILEDENTEDEVKFEILQECTKIQKKRL